MGAVAGSVDLPRRLRGALPRNLLPRRRPTLGASAATSRRTQVVTIGVRHGSPTAVAHRPLLTAPPPPAHSHDGTHGGSVTGERVRSCLPGGKSRGRVTLVVIGWR